MARRSMARPTSENASAKAAPKPLVDAVTVTDFGGIEDAEVFKYQAERDYTYVPGFSEMKRAQDLAKAEFAAGARQAKDIPTLPVNLRWSRCVGSHPKLADAQAQGYRAVVKGDLDAKHSWLTGLPPGAKYTPSGEIVNAAGDLMLQVADASTAARNAAKKMQKSKSMAEAVGAAAFTTAGATVRGANPTVSKV